MRCDKMQRHTPHATAHARDAFAPLGDNAPIVWVLLSQTYPFQSHFVLNGCDLELPKLSLQFFYIRLRCRPCLPL